MTHPIPAIPADTYGASLPMYNRLHKIAGGAYIHPQPHYFITVRKYSIVHENKHENEPNSTNYKTVFFQLCNELPYNVHAIRFRLMQIDRAGSVIQQSIHEYTFLPVAPGQIFTPNFGVIVEEECADITFEIIQADTDIYQYTYNHGERVVRIMEDAGIRSPSKPKKHSAGKQKLLVRVTDKTVYPLKKMIWIVIAMMSVLCAVTVYSVLYERVSQPIQNFVVDICLRSVIRFITVTVPKWMANVFGEVIPRALSHFFGEILPNVFTEIFDNMIPNLLQRLTWLFRFLLI